MEKKKNIDAKVAVKGLITGFVSYGILIIFLFFTLAIFIAWLIGNNIDAFYNYNLVKYSLTIIGGFILFFFIRLICKLSTIDLLNKCKIKKDDINKVASKMNIFFICFTIFLLIIIITSLLARFNLQKSEIQLKDAKYHSTLPYEFAETLTDSLIKDYQIQKSHTILQTTILEIGVILGIFSLIPTQKRLLEKYNT